MNVSVNLLVRYFGVLKSLLFLKLYILDDTLGGSRLRSLCSSSLKTDSKSILHRSHLVNIRLAIPTHLERSDKIIEGR